MVTGIIRRIVIGLAITVGIITALVAAVVTTVIISLFSDPYFTSFSDAHPDCVWTGTPGFPFSNENIQLKSQEVNIRLKSGFYEVDGVYRFFNPGPTREKWFAFPKGYSVLVFPGSSPPRFALFEAYVNDTKMTCQTDHGFFWNSRFALARILNGGCFYTQWCASKLRFPGHSTTVIRARYHAIYIGCCGQSTGKYVIRTCLSRGLSPQRSLFRVESPGSYHVHFGGALMVQEEEWRQPPFFMEVSNPEQLPKGIVVER